MGVGDVIREHLDRIQHFPSDGQDAFKPHLGEVIAAMEGLYFAVSLNLNIDPLDMNARNAVQAINSPSFFLFCDVDLHVSDIKVVCNQVNLSKCVTISRDCNELNDF